MNWKEQPHLFANGKFRCKENNLLITGITWMNKEPKFWFENDRYFWAKECRLIARPIEDMTDEEVENINDNFPTHILRTSWKRQIEIDNLPFSTARKFLSIGVYPFSDTEDVIFKTKENANN